MKSLNCLTKYFVVLAVIASFASLPGCGDGRPKTIKVTGRVTLGGGDWPKEGLLYFTPLAPAEGYPRKPGTGAFGTDGKFRAGTWKKADGLVPGKYRVSVECWEHEPSMKPGAPAAKSYVPKEYQSAQETIWEIDVTVDGGAVEIEKDLPKP